MELLQSSNLGSPRHIPGIPFLGVATKSQTTQDYLRNRQSLFYSVNFLSSEDKTFINLTGKRKQGYDYVAIKVTYDQRPVRKVTNSGEYLRKNVLGRY